MIAPAIFLALTLVQSSVACDWTKRADGKLYICASPENKNAVVAFVCDSKTKGIKQINFTILTGKQGISGRMSVKNGGNEVQIPMIGLKVGLNGFVSPAVPEALASVTKLLEGAKGPLTLTAIDPPEGTPVSIDGAAIANALKTAVASCKE
jgi:hypothetical protein